MSTIQPGQADQRRSPNLMLNLSSNNPFRNRAASPGLASPQSSPLDPPRPVSRNPFLDGTSSSFNQQSSLTSPTNMYSANGSISPRPVLTGNAAELFDNLAIEDKPSAPPNRMPPPRPNQEMSRPAPPRTSTSSRGENVPPRGPPDHRPSRSQEEEIMRARRREMASSSGGKPAPPGTLDIFADPSDSARKPDQRRVRRNSDSSIVSRNSKLIETEEDKKRQERRRRERRHRDRREKKPNGKLDIIDKLDGTSIYGTGLFHHDGPFDACNPHRNRQGSKRAPMHAFAKDSLNNVLGGGGPLNKKPDHATFLGNNDEEAFKDYSKGGAAYNEYEPYENGPSRPTPAKPEPTVLSATSRVEPIHGEETLGLGTSTFLEGAPASRTAMQRRESETTLTVEGGLSRKKSLAQKIRGINNNRRDYGPSGRITSPEGVYTVKSPGTPLFTPGGSKINEMNPFSNEFGKNDESRRENITIVEPEKTGGARAPSSPRRGMGERLERRVTSDGSSGAEQQQQPQPPKSAGGGFLSRVKSLKGGPRKPKVDRPMPQEPALS